jgi:hypothetical protein
MIRKLEYDALGPYAPGEEARFKADILAVYKNDPECNAFMIETEETTPGFPDVLYCRGEEYFMMEIKVSDKRGVITFQKSQPLFYKQHPKLWLAIVAWDVPRNRAVSITPNEIIKARSLSFKLPEEVE